MWVAIVLIVGGLLVLFYQYTINKNLFHVLMNNSVVQGSLGVLQKMLWATLAMLVGFMLLSASFKLGSYVKQREEEKRIAEYRVQCKDELFRLFSKWFFDLWD